MKNLVFFICLITSLKAISQQSPIPAEQRKGIIKDVFIYDTAPFPSCHAATIVETPKGLVAAWFAGKYEGSDDVNIYTSHFKNGKWTTPAIAAEGWMNDSVRHACYNPVLYQVPGKELILFYKIGPNVQGWTGWLKRSFDNGKTWSKAEAIPNGFLGPIRNNAYLANGLLICPSSTEKTGWKVHFEFTRDNGKTWSKSPDLNDGKSITGIQPAVLTHGNNTLQALCRSQDGTINETWSYDNGRTWKALAKTTMPNNNSGIDAITLKNGMHLLVYNNVKPSSDNNEGIGVRSPLNVAISKDGKEWKDILVLENEKGAEFSYPYVIQSKDGLVHIVYTWKRKKIKYMVLKVS